MSEFVIIAGLSGAGRTTAADTLDDLGWFVIDNMPPALIMKVAELADRPGSDTERVALVVGRGGGDHVSEVTEALDALRLSGARVRVVFLTAGDEVLVRRFEANKRRHPVDAEGVADSIAQERAALEPLKAQADLVIDTSELNLHQLRDRLVELFHEDDPTVPMQTSVVSFGFKNGVPLDVDNVFDCRFLDNPYWVDELRPLTGLDEAVRDHVLGQPEAKEFLEHIDGLLGLLLPAYVKEGKSYLRIAVGCTGGRHRSVVLAEEIAKAVERRGYRPLVQHRDLDR